MNFYPFHIGDYAAHTAHLSPIEDIAYRRLLDLCYLTEKPLMHDVERLSRLVRLSDHVEAVRVVLDEFFQATDEGWVSPRAVQEIATYEDKRQKAKASARASVSVRSTNAQRTFNERSTDVQLPEPEPLPEPTNTQPSAVVETPGVSPKQPRVKVLTIKDLMAEGVSEQHAADWLKVRKDKKAPLTVTAWEGVKREAELARLTPAQAVKTSAENGWQGFKASWLDRISGPVAEARQVETRAVVAVQKTEAYLAEQEEHAKAARSDASREAARAALAALGRKVKEV